MFGDVLILGQAVDKTKMTTTAFCFNGDVFIQSERNGVILQTFIIEPGSIPMLARVFATLKRQPIAPDADAETD